MTRHAFRLLALVALVPLAACGGGGSGAVSPSVSNATGAPSGGNVVTLQIALGASSASAVRSPAYISAAARGLQVVASHTDPVAGNVTATTDADISSTSPLCSGSLCSIPVDVQPGVANSLTVTEVDQQPDNAGTTGIGTGFTSAQAHALAVGSTTANPVVNSQNIVQVALNPIAASLALAVTVGATGGGASRYIVPADGTTQQLTIALSPLDFDGNRIATNGQSFVNQSGTATALSVTLGSIADITFGPSAATASFASSSTAGALTATATYDGTGTAAITLTGSNGLSNNPSALFGGTYASSPTLTIAPFSAAPTYLLDVSGSTSTLAVSEPGETVGFTISTCLDVNGNPVATISPANSLSAGGQQFSILRVHPGACTFTLTDSSGVSIGIGVASVGSIPIPFHIGPSGLTSHARTSLSH